MTKKKVLVKPLAAIEDFGSIDILCSDKTGTLTEGEIVLDRHVDVQGKGDDNVLRMIYLNSYFEAGIKSPLDAAILKHEHPSIVEYEKVDEIPFDFNRKRLSVVVRRGDEDLLIIKGEADTPSGSQHFHGSPQPTTPAVRKASPWFRSVANARSARRDQQCRSCRQRPWARQLFQRAP